MDPISLLVAALATGATAALNETAGSAVRDAYSGLKALLTRKIGDKTSIQSLEEKPTSKERQNAAKEDLVAAKAETDPEVLEMAREVVAVVRRESPEVGGALGLDLEGIEGAFLQV